MSDAKYTKKSTPNTSRSKDMYYVLKDHILLVLSTKLILMKSQPVSLVRTISY